MRNYKGIELNKSNVEWAVRLALNVGKVGNEMLEDAAKMEARADEITKNTPVEEMTKDNPLFVAALQLKYTAYELRRYYEELTR